MKLPKKLLALLLSVVLVFSVIPAGAVVVNAEAAVKNTLKFATMSDIHFYPQELMPEKGTPEYEKWQTVCRSKSKEFDYSPQIVDTALKTLAARAEEQGIKYLLLSGDLTKDSELAAHKGLAQKMEQFEKETGIQVIAINGNHDVNMTDASSFVTGEREYAEAITQQGFYDVYKNLGYDLADEVYGFKNGKTLNMVNGLSYTVQLDDNTQLIVVDSNKYSLGEPEKQKTDGAITEECLNWILEKADEATSQGKQNLVMIHHNMAPHVECEPSVIYAFPIDDYLRVAETFADHNIHYTFSGHLHQPDTAMVINDNGNVLYDIETASLTSYPNLYDEITFTAYDDNEADLHIETVDFDKESQFLDYAQGEFKKDSFSLIFGGALSDDPNGVPTVEGFAKGLLSGFGSGMFKDIENEGGLLAYLKNHANIDLQKILADFLKPYIGNGIKLGSNSWLSADNIMWFIEDLLDQVSQQYIYDFDNLWETLEPMLKKLAEIRVSDYPVSDVVREATGLGYDHNYGTLEDVIFSVVYYFYTGNENKLEDDKMLNDAINKLYGGITDLGIFDVVVDIAFNDLVDGAILSKLEIRADKFFNSDYYSQKAAEGLNYLLKYFLRNDFTYLNLVNTIFGIGILPYDSIFDIIDQKLIQEYWTDSQDESIGCLVAKFLVDFATDEDPLYKGDYGEKATYSTKKREVPVSTANYRSPTMISTTIGDDAETSAYISWFSKNTLKDTDIQILEKGTNTFTGNIEKSEEIVERFFPGIDLGIIGFFNYNFTMYRHTVKLTNLKPGTVYSYRVGNAERGWWSGERTFETASGTNEVTFFHMSDPQSQSEKQYTRGWANVVKTAFSMYPEAKFIANTGDLVDYGMNTNMWQWMFDTASSTGSMDLGNTFLMPTTGNHESFSDYSTVSNFRLPNVPEQDTASGVYYSFDYNNVHISVLNTNDLNSKEALSDKQVEWLRKDVTASDKQWKVVMLHKALYSNGSHYDDDDVVAMRAQLGTLMPELGIDLVLQGHDHVYLRTASLKGNQKTNDAITYLSYNDKAYKTTVLPTGTTYEISGCAGVKIYRTKDVSATDKYFPRADKIVDADRAMFSAVQIKDGILYFDAYLVAEDGSAQCVDSYAIQKDTAQGDVIPEEDWPQTEDEGTASGNIFTKLINIIKKIFNIAWNLYQMYVKGAGLKK